VIWPPPLGGPMNLWQDVRFALRTMWKSPRITATVLLTLALGIGANTAIFSVVNATLLLPLPFHDPEQLVVLHADLRGLGAQSVGFSVPELDDLRDRAGVFSAVSVVYQGPTNLTGGEHPERLESGVVSPNYFSILGARPQLGRLFDPGDTAPGFADAVVITDGLWHREFGGERSVLGHQMPRYRSVHHRGRTSAGLSESLIGWRCSGGTIRHRGLSRRSVSAAAA